MSAFGLSKQLGIPREAAQTYIDQYFLRYPGVQAYMEETRALACRQGYVTTLQGRRLSVPDIHSSQLQKRRAAERAAINAPLQGTAADMIKLAMIAMDAWLQKTAVEAHMIMQVHDELVFEVAEKAVQPLIPVIREKMMHVMTLLVPLEVQVSVGNNWDEAHE
jgi:DNA polymerase-1